MSNRDRIDRLREEAAATARERADATKREKADGTKREKRPARAKAGASGPERLKLVWAVKNGAGEVVATYPYPRKAAAEAEAERLKESTRGTHIVCPHKVPFED